jgi:hypothetical protein
MADAEAKLRIARGRLKEVRNQVEGARAQLAAMENVDEMSGFESESGLSMQRAYGGHKALEGVCIQYEGDTEFL